MLRPSLLQVARQYQKPSVCVFCASRSLQQSQTRLFSAVAPRLKSYKDQTSVSDAKVGSEADVKAGSGKDEGKDGSSSTNPKEQTKRKGRRRGKNKRRIRPSQEGVLKVRTVPSKLFRKIQSTGPELVIKKVAQEDSAPKNIEDAVKEGSGQPTSLKEALLASGTKKERKQKALGPPLEIKNLNADDLALEPIPHDIPAIPKLAYGLDRVLFNPGVYRLQDPRSRVYNFDPYLEKIMPVAEFDFDALTEYRTSSKDPDLLAINERLGTKFTGSTSSMSGVLQHFHFLLSHFRQLNHEMMSRQFPLKTSRFSKITLGPTAIFLRWKDGRYAIDADKAMDEPNVMSWLGHSLEKLLTNSKDEFEKYRKSSPEQPTDEDDSGKCFHYTRLGNFLMRSQLDAQDGRLPGTGVFDLKTRAVVSIRMHSDDFETGSGYQIRYDQGQWESYEREFYDMTRATLLKYSLQVRMGRMDGIFVAYHNIERMFGFQYLSLPDMDQVLHGQTDTCLGDQEFKLSITLLDELLQRATEKFPETSLRLHFEACDSATPYMYVFAVPVTEEQADRIQDSRSLARKEFERNVVGIKKDDPEVQAEWQDIQSQVDEEVEKKQSEDNATETEATAESENQNAVKSEDNVDPQGKYDVHVEEECGQNAPGVLMGWTLTIRNRVNGAYVKRPQNLQPSDDWSIEYHIQEIGEDAKLNAYQKLRQRRKKLIGLGKAERDRAMQAYRELIKEYSLAGREWRQEQDKIDAELGQRVYRPLGPGSEES